MKMLTVDPGLNTGWASWYKDELLDSGIIKKPSLAIEEYAGHRLTYYWSQFDTLLYKICPKICIIESVTIYAGSAKSMASATKGNLTFLSILIGGYVRDCARRGLDFKLIEAREWKGTMSKAITEKRIKKVNPNLTITNNHVLDAIGIGYSHLGKL